MGVGEVLQREKWKERWSFKVPCGYWFCRRAVECELGFRVVLTKTKEVGFIVYYTLILAPGGAWKFPGTFVILTLQKKHPVVAWGQSWKKKKKRQYWLLEKKEYFFKKVGKVEREKEGKKEKEKERGRERGKGKKEEWERGKKFFKVKKEGLWEI